MRDLQPEENGPHARGDKVNPMNDDRDDDEIDLGQLLATIWRGKFWIALCVALAFAGGLFHIANTPPTFQADALLQLEERSGRLALPSAMRDLVDSDPRSVTEIEVMRSRMVLGQVVADLNLDWQVQPAKAPLIGEMLSRYRLPIPAIDLLRDYARPGERLEIDLLSVPPRWVNRDLALTVVDRGFRIETPDGEMLEGVPGESLSLPELGFALNVTEMRAPSGRVYLIRQRDELAAINNLRSRVTISERGRGSGMLEVRFTGPNRAENIRVLNSLIGAYLRQNIARSAAEAESSLDFIRGQLPLAERALRDAEAALNDYRQEQVTVDLSFETQNILTQITRIEGELRELQRREDEVSQRYTPSHPTYRQLLDDRARLEARLGELRGEAGALPETQREILNLTRNVELAQRIYTQLLTRAQEIEVLRASTVGNVRIVDAAASGGGAVAPRRSLIVALAAVLGAMAGVGLVLVREWLRKGIQDASELEKAGLPVLATINYTPHADLKKARKGELPILALTDPMDLAVEAFRSLRTSLHFGMLDAETRTLTVTSSHPEAGKSFCSVNLAVTAAQAGQKVCLVDADLRRGQLRRHFQVPRNHPGLAEVLSGDVGLEDALVEGPVPGLVFLSTGRYPPNPSELLMRRELSELITHLHRKVDLSIFDSPPALAVTDPVILGSATGATILVARHDVTPIGEVAAVLKAYQTAGLRLSGAILNGFDPRKARAGYGYGYGYRYTYKQRKE